MRMNSRLFVRCVLVGMAFALLVGAVPACFGGYSVGVKAGDWVKYEGSASGMEPEEFLDFNQTLWMKGEVLGVSGTTVTVQMTAHYKNGSEEVERLVGDVATASGNLSFMIVPAGLGKGDALPLAMFDGGQTGLIINDTVTRTYLGASRSVNVFSISVSEDYASVEVGAYWDQATGVLLELSMQVSTTDENMQMSIEAIETNMWSAGGLGDISGFLADNLIYIVGITAVVVVAVVAGVLILRRPKPIQVMVPTSVPTGEKAA